MREIQNWKSGSSRRNDLQSHSLTHQVHTFMPYRAEHTGPATPPLPSHTNHLETISMLIAHFHLKQQTAQTTTAHLHLVPFLIIHSSSEATSSKATRELAGVKRFLNERPSNLVASPTNQPTPRITAKQQIT